MRSLVCWTVCLLGAASCHLDARGNVTSEPRSTPLPTLRVEAPRTSAKPASSRVLRRIDRVRIFKSQRRLELLEGTLVRAEFPISLGFAPLGQKEQEGDGRTPEGLYSVDGHNAHSRYHLSLHLSYPTAAQRERARARGVSPGGDIMIHGVPNGISDMWASALSARDWTAGCIAVTNDAIELIYSSVRDGVVVQIEP